MDEPALKIIDVFICKLRRLTAGLLFGRPRRQVADAGAG